LAERDARILLLTGDLGYMALEPFADKFPSRFVNVGVAEQNMVGLATGLAESGFIPFVYSITPFITLRPYEFIRNGPVQHSLPVRIVGIGGGFEYATNGISHYGLEDVGVMRIQPGLTVVTPADHEQAGSAIQATWELPGPVYYRLGKDDRTTVPGLGGSFQLGRTQVLRDGRDVLLVAMGSVATEAVAAAQVLEKQGISVRVVLVSSFNPAPIEDLIVHLGAIQRVVTIEAHYSTGGVGSLVCEIAAENGLTCQVARCAVGSCNDGVTGNQKFLYVRHGLNAEAIAETANRLLGTTKTWASPT
jgi:transketolase